MTFVIPPTQPTPAGNAQLLASLGQDLKAFRGVTIGDEQRDDMLRSAARLTAADANFDDYWLGEAADAFSRSAIASRDRLRKAYRTLGQGGEAAITLATAISTAQAAMFQAQAIAQARAQQASLNPIPTDPITLFGDLWSIDASVRSSLEEAHREATATWKNLTKAAPHYVAPKKKAAEKKRPFWKKVEGVLDKATYIPGPVGMVASAGMTGVKLAQGDKKGALGYSIGMAPGGKQAKMAYTGIKVIKGADKVKDTSRAVSKAEQNVSKSVGGPGGVGRGAGDVNGPGGRPNKLPDQSDQAPNEVPRIPKTGGARGDAGTGAGHQHPGQPRNPFGWPRKQGPLDIENGVRDVLDNLAKMFGLRNPAPRPRPFFGFRPNFPTVVFPQPGMRPA